MTTLKNEDFIPPRDGVIEANEPKKLDTADQLAKKDFAKELKEKVISGFLIKLRRNWKLALGAAFAGVAFGAGALTKSSCCDDSATNLVQSEIDRIKKQPDNPIHVGLSIMYNPEDMSLDVLDSSVNMHMDNCGQQHEGIVNKGGMTKMEAGGILVKKIEVKFDNPHDGEPHCYIADTYLQKSDFTETSTGPDALFIAKKVHFEMAHEKCDAE